MHVNSTELCVTNWHAKKGRAAKQGSSTILSPGNSLRLGTPLTAFTAVSFPSALRSSNSKADADGLTLLELQVGLCCLDPLTPHGGVCGQLRCQMIYNFYNTLGKNGLAFDDFK